MIKFNECTDGKVKFNDLRPGDTFRYGHAVFIKVSLVTEESNSMWNAVDLADGDFSLFVPDDEVEVVDIEATIK